MRIISGIIAIAVASTVSIAQAQKAPKAKAGKCGVGMFFDKKTKACASKM